MGATHIFKAVKKKRNFSRFQSLNYKFCHVQDLGSRWDVAAEISFPFTFEPFLLFKAHKAKIHERVKSALLGSKNPEPLSIPPGENISAWCFGMSSFTRDQKTETISSLKQQNPVRSLCPEFRLSALQTPQWSWTCDAAARLLHSYFILNMTRDREAGVKEENTETRREWESDGGGFVVLRVFRMW